MLNAGANISKAFWGQGGKLAAERKPLRDSVGIRDDSIIHETLMRNHFEHFDERLDRWWGDSKAHNIVDQYIGPRDKIVIQPTEPIDWFRLFDPRTTDVFFWGDDFNLQALINEVETILPKLREEASKPHWQA